jgi:uncharacterized RDD family membrane protein YckC
VATAPYPGYAAVPPEGEHASFGLRLGAFLLDSLLYGLLSLVFIVPGVVMIIASFRDCETVDRFDGTTDIVCPDGAPEAGLIAGGIGVMLLGVLFVAFLYVRAMGRTGQPWGARIVGVKVVKQGTGATIGFGAALGRSLFANIFSSAVFYLGYLWMLWDDQQQTWHDKVVSSVVVKV